MSKALLQKLKFDEDKCIWLVLAVFKLVRIIAALAFLVFAATVAAYFYYLSDDSLHSAGRLFSHSSSEAENIIDLLTLADGFLLATTLMLIIFGSISIYVLPDFDQTRMPSALRNITSGKLKEKLSSSLITISAVYLLKIVIQFSAGVAGDSGAQVTLKQFEIIGPIHLMFIIGYFVIAQSNRLDPHDNPPGGHVPVQRHDSDGHVNQNGHADAPPAVPDVHPAHQKTSTHTGENHV